MSSVYSVRRSAAVGVAALLVVASFLQAQEASPAKVLFDGTKEDSARLLKPSDSSVSVVNSQNGTTDVTTEITIKPSEAGYPGVELTPESGTWDLSAFGRIEAKLVNTGEKPISVSIRVDDNGDWKTNPWNGENLHLKPGATGTAVVRFGYSWGKPAHKLKSDSVVRVLLFTGKQKEQASIRLVSIEAKGRPGEAPPVDPASVRVVPKDGYLFGPGISLDAEKQITASHAKTSLNGSTLAISFPAGRQDATVSVKPPQGRWDLRQMLQTTVTLRNTGNSPVTPRVKLTSNGGETPWVAGEPIAAGATGQVVVPFSAGMPFDFSDKKSGTKFNSDATAAVVLATTGDTSAERTLVVESIHAGIPASLDTPEWLGKRPPAEGNWKLTFEDNFDGDKIDEKKWNIYTENYWDKRTHFSKDNTIVSNGSVKLRYEKKRGHENDDPSRKQTDYACGFLDAYGKFTQRYGYFEARMKLPTAPGLWPAFWTMPDRGEAAGPQWKRAATENGGMELDIMEHLTRWGPYRYNIAHHWDGYGKNHKANGTSNAYVTPDKDGYITSGVLWLPGKTVYYCNGVEIARWENERVGSVESYPILYMVSGGWDNNALDDSKLPADFEIDYIRIWQRDDLARPEDGFKNGPSKK